MKSVMLKKSIRRRRWGIARILFIFAIAASISPFGASGKSALAQKNDEVTLIIRASPEADYQTVVSIEDSALRRELSLGRTKAVAPDLSLLYADATIAVHSGGESKTFIASPAGAVTAVDSNAVLVLSPAAKASLRTLIAAARSQHYGELLEWGQLNKKLPKYAKFEVTDLETGLTFRGQRRAGSSHADVQPLTKADSSVMKRIYHNRWSWQRRAVLIHYDGHVYAGSMNGMPHGGDGIPDNDFKGHFCIHFLGSKTHKHKQLDLAHQAMTYKASGRLSEFVSRMNTNQLIELWLFAINEQDTAIKRAIVRPRTPNEEPIPDIESISRMGRNKASRSSKASSSQTPNEADNNLTLVKQVQMQCVLSVKGDRRRSGTVTLTLVRSSPFDRWVLEGIELPPKSDNKENSQSIQKR